MEKKIINYRVIIEPEKVGNKIVYTAYCPSLEVVDYGDTIEEVLISIKDGIELALECLKEEKKEIPLDNITDQFITSVPVNTNHYFSFS